MHQKSQKLIKKLIGENEHPKVKMKNISKLYFHMIFFGFGFLPKLIVLLYEKKYFKKMQQVASLYVYLNASKCFWTNYLQCVDIAKSRLYLFFSPTRYNTGIADLNGVIGDLYAGKVSHSFRVVCEG